MKIIYRLVILIVSVAMITGFNLRQPVTYANIQACNASVSSHDVDSASIVDFSFAIENPGGNSYAWIQILRPQGGYYINEATVSGWDQALTESALTLSGGSVASGETLDVTISAQTANPSTPPSNWTILVSDSANGQSPFSCSGDLSARINQQRPDGDPPIISNIRLSRITQTSVTISWTTDEAADSQIDYGETVVYDSQTALDENFVTSHNVGLNNLKTYTGYHFRIFSEDELGNGDYSDDNTFFTLAWPTNNPTPPPADSPTPSGTLPTPNSGPTLNNPNLPANSSNSNSTTTPSASGAPITPGDTDPPQITLDSIPGQPFTDPPDMAGRASDNIAVVEVEYSTDGGQNWLPVEFLDHRNTQTVSFRFHPLNLGDGNYLVMARATDASGNRSLTNPQVMVIDRQPPVIGGSTISLGPTILMPDAEGVLASSVGADQKLTLQAAGGAIEVRISAKKVVVDDKADRQPDQVYILSPVAQDQLWSGIINFSQPGLYDLNAEAIDGANNHTARPLYRVMAADNSVVVDQNALSPIAEARVTIHYRESHLTSWKVWDAAAFGQQNPQNTNKLGHFASFLPPGQYYLSVKATGYQKTVSDIITLATYQPLTVQIPLNHGLRVGSFSLKWPWPKAINLPTGGYSTHPKSADPYSYLLDHDIPNLTLTRLNGQTIKPIDLYGKPTVLTLINSWTPAMTEQLSALQELQKNNDLNIIPVTPLESAEKIEALVAVGGYDLAFYNDDSDSLTESLRFVTGPTHYFINRRGIVKLVRVGVLSEKELIDQLTKL